MLSRAATRGNEGSSARSSTTVLATEMARPSTSPALPDQPHHTALRQRQPPGWVARGVELPDLNARSASLEEAFLAVAGSTSEHTDDQEMAA